MNPAAANPAFVTAAARARRRARVAPLVLAAAMALLAACSIIPEKTPLSIYAPDPRIQADPAWPTVDWQLLVPRPNASALVDSPRIAVRPVPGELQVYKGAVWTQPAPEIVQDAVVHGFEDSGRIQGVARRGEGISGDYQLQLDIRRFDSDYGANGAPAATIEIGAKLVASDTNQVVASKLFRHTAPAAATDIGHVAAAFEQALGASTTAIVGWTLAEGQRDAGSRGAPAP
jgi:cholesterol transport system auxiliary component